jgi:transcription elongation factor Elf1
MHEAALTAVKRKKTARQPTRVPTRALSHHRSEALSRQVPYVDCVNHKVTILGRYELAKGIVAGKLCGRCNRFDHRAHDEHVDIYSKGTDERAKHGDEGANYEEVTAAEDIRESANYSLKELAEFRCTRIGIL